MEYRLKEIGTIITGGTPKTKNAEYYSKKEYLFIGPTDIKNCKYVIKSEKYVSNEAYKDYQKKFIGKNSIMIDCIGSDMGNVAISVNNVLTNQQINSITNIDEKNFNVEYIYYVLSTMKKYFHQIGTNGSTMPIINKTMFEDIIIDIPDKKIQDKVATILSKLDQKIELNNQINDNLHEIVKTIYKELFIDNNQESWKKEKLGKYLMIDRGLSYKGKYLSDSGTPMINLGNVMPNGVFRLEKNKYYSGEYKDKVVAQIGDIVIANTDMTQDRAVIGTPVIIPPIYDGEVIFSHHIYCLRNLQLPKMYIFYTLLTEEWNGIAAGNATGTTVLALPKEVIEDYEIIIPNNDMLQKFENIANNIQSRREQIILENIRLTTLRDTLLPKLMNEEIDLDKIEI